MARQHNKASPSEAYFTLDLVEQELGQEGMTGRQAAASGSSRLISFICSFDDDDADDAGAGVRA